jgi:outer membrane protein assembly factor BamB
VWKDYTIKVTKPNDEIETLGPFDSGSTGSGFTLYTPDQVGNYTFMVTFPEQTWPDEAPYPSQYRGATWLESTYTTVVTVQQEPVPTLNIYWPLPTEYWTRPIEGQNNEWYRVSSNWLNSPRDAAYGWIDSFYQQDGVAPNSAHVLWTYAYEDGGVVGGGSYTDDKLGEVFFSGTQYNMRITYPIIMHGRVYFPLPIGNSGGGTSNMWIGSGWECIDLRTGELIWKNTQMGVAGGLPAPQFGYYYSYDTMNQHGVIPGGLIFSQDFGQAYDPLTGDTRFQLTNVPSVSRPTYAVASPQETVGPRGEHIRYNLVNLGTRSNPDYYLQQWNSSNVFVTQTSGVIPANCPLDSVHHSPNNYWNGSDWVTSSVRNQQGYASVTSPAFDYNVSVPWINERSSIQIMAVILDDILLCSNGTNPYSSGAETPAFPDEVTYFGISLKSNTYGQKVWENTITTKTDDNKQLVFRRAGEGIFALYWSPVVQWVAYDMHTGKELWTAAKEETADNPFAYFIASSYYNRYAHAISNGRVYSTGYSGHVYCYNATNGNLMWVYKAPTGMRIFEYYPTFIGASGDGKMYLASHEHSADSPLFKGHEVVALNDTTGEVIWHMLDWGNPESFAIADGEVIYNNLYDQQIYAVGKGPTSTTVSAPDTAAAFGTPVVIKGTVTDISAGTQQPEQAARFPNGLPAVSEDSMGDWMEYVYMQKPRPINATGVEVTLSVLDSNNNFRDIGTVTSDSDGFYSLEWTPDIPGKFKVIASFAGSEGYWPSQAVSAFTVMEAPESTPPPTPAPAPATDMYVLGSTAGIIIAIVVVGLVIVLMLRKR